MSLLHKVEVQKTCEVCGSYLVNIISGAVCLKGCGKIHPRVDRVTSARGEGMFIPDAKKIDGIVCTTDEAKKMEATSRDLYTLDGSPGIFVRVKRTGTGVNAGEGHVIGVISEEDDSSLREFARHEALEKLLISTVSQKDDENDDSEEGEAE